MLATHAAASLSRSMQCRRCQVFHVLQRSPPMLLQLLCTAEAVRSPIPPTGCGAGASVEAKPSGCFLARINSNSYECTCASGRAALVACSVGKQPICLPAALFGPRPRLLGAVQVPAGPRVARLNSQLDRGRMPHEADELTTGWSKVWLV